MASKLPVDRITHINAFIIAASYCNPSVDFLPIVEQLLHRGDIPLIKELVRDCYRKHPRRQAVEITLKKAPEYLKECLTEGSIEDILRYGVTCIEYLRSIRVDYASQFHVYIPIEKMRMCLENIYDAYRLVEKGDYYRTISLMSNLRLVIGENWVTDYIDQVQKMLHAEEPEVIEDIFGLGIIFATDFA